MKPRNSYNALVIVGAWNVPIFTPEWMNRYVYTQPKDLIVEYPQIPIQASLKFTCDNVGIYVADNRLFFSAEKTDVNTFNTIGENALAICRSLIHTPVQSFGINHVFECSFDEIKDKDIFTFKDDEKYENCGYDVESVQVNRTIKFQNHILNIIWRKVGDTVTIEFNNDYRISDIQQFITLFEDRIIEERKNNAIEFLKKVYDIDVD